MSRARFLALIGLSTSAPLSAQVVPRDTAALPAVAVTATRNSRSILTTPLAVTLIPQSALRSVSGHGLEEALARVPGVIASSRYGTSDVRLVIRGFGARGAGDRSNAGTSRGVRVLIDGFPETEPDGRTAFDHVDLALSDNVEVVRSNASSIWGNAAGGVVNVLTMPSAASPPFEIQPVLGSNGLARVALRATAPLGSGRVWGGFTNTTFEGWRKHSDARRSVFNGGAAGTIGSATRLGVYVSAANNLMHIPGPLTQAQYDADPTQANATYLARDERRYNRLGRVGASLDHEFNAVTSLSSSFYVNPKYLQRSERGTYRDFTRFHFGGQLVARRALEMGATRSLFSLGADQAYQDGAILFYSLSPTNERGGTLMDNKGEGAHNVGFFLQNELAVSSNLSFLLGARYDRVAYYYRSFLPVAPVRSDSRSYERVSPKLGASWKTSATSALYANIGGGIEAPAGNETNPPPGTSGPTPLLNPLLDAISSTTYELGYRKFDVVLGEMLAASLDLAAYNTEVSNEIVPYNGGRFYQTAARARRQGVEIGVNALLPAGVFASAAFTFSRNRYVNYVVDSAVQFPADPTKAGKRADYSNNEVVGVPGRVVNTELGMAIPGLDRLRLKGVVEHSGSYFADDANAVRVPGYTLINLSAELRESVRLWGTLGVRGFVTVNNVANRRHIGSAFLNPDIVNGEAAVYEPGMPRSAVVSLSVSRLGKR